MLLRGHIFRDRQVDRLLSDDVSKNWPAGATRNLFKCFAVQEAVPRCRPELEMVCIFFPRCEMN